MPLRYTRTGIARAHADRLSSDRLTAAASQLFRHVRYAPLNSAAHAAVLTEFQQFVEEMSRNHHASLSRAASAFYMSAPALAEIAHDGMKFMRFAYLCGTSANLEERRRLESECSRRNLFNLTWFLYALGPNTRARLCQAYRRKAGNHSAPLAGVDNLPLICTFACSTCGNFRPLLLLAPGGECIFCATNSRGAINRSHSADPIALCLNGSFERPTNQHYLGLELEYESSSERFTAQIARQLVEKSDNTLICKRDGSLQSGAEICTIPMTLDEHAKLWEKLFSISDWTEGAICEESPRPGLHVHISRKPAGLMQMARYARFMQGPAGTLTRYIAGRGDNSYARYRPSLSIPEILRELNHGPQTDKYNVINMKHAATLEVRAYKSTKFYDLLMARAEYTHAAMLFVARMKAEELTVARFLDWLSKSRNRGQYSHLCKLVKNFRAGAPNTFSTPSAGFVLPRAVTSAHNTIPDGRNLSVTLDLEGNALPTRGFYPVEPPFPRSTFPEAMRAISGEDVILPADDPFRPIRARNRDNH